MADLDRLALLRALADGTAVIEIVDVIEEDDVPTAIRVERFRRPVLGPGLRAELDAADSIAADPGTDHP